MELKEKMAFFDEQVMKEANQVIDQQLDQYQQTLQKDYEAYAKRLRANNATRLENEKTNIRKENNKEISQTQIKQQRDLYVEEEKLKKSLFHSFREELAKYIQSDAYVEQLKKMIQSVEDFAHDEDLIIYINASDAHLMNQLSIKPNGEIKVSDRDFIGGIRGVLTSRNILVDNSFSTLLENEQENFVLKEVDASERS